MWLGVMTPAALNRLAQRPVQVVPHPVLARHGSEQYITRHPSTAPSPHLHQCRRQSSLSKPPRISTGLDGSSSSWGSSSNSSDTCPRNLWSAAKPSLSQGP